VLHQRIAAAKDARPDMRVINIDPRRTATTELADIHLQIAPEDPKGRDRLFPRCEPIRDGHR